jgi:hypothetical protein
MPANCSLRRFALADMPTDVEAKVCEFLRGHPEARIEHEPAWLRAEQADHIDHLYMTLIEQGDELIGLIPFVLKDRPLKIFAGEIQIARLPLRRMSILGGMHLVPESDEVLDRFFLMVLEDDGLGFDAIWMETVADESFLDAYFRRSHALRDCFREYLVESSRPHHRVEFPPTFEAYMAKFKTKTRNTLRRGLRKLEKSSGEPVVAQRYSRLEEVEGFIHDAVPVSKQSYQWNLLKIGLRDEGALRLQLSTAAEHGWLRSYVLKVGSTPIAFMLGWQYNGRYDYVDVGFDQAWRKHSPGRVLQMMVFDDLYGEDTPASFEFGIHGEHKAAFGNQTYQARSVHLFRPGLYPRAATTLYRASDRASEAAVRVLDDLGVKRQIKKLLRRLSVS